LLKRALCVIMAAVFLSLSLTSCGSGSATATAAGYRGDIRLQVTVTKDGDSRRLEVRQISNSETAGIGDYGVAATVSRMNELQSVHVDAVAGATVSSMATIAAAEKAVEKLGSYAQVFLQDAVIPPTEYRTFDCDVVIVGAGGAGLVAAIEAASGGADVLVLERMGVPGGSTARSGGRIMATGSDLQQKYRETDSTASFAGFLCTYSDPALGSFRQLELAEHSADNLRFLESNGVKFSNTLFSTYEGQSPKRVHQVQSTSSDGAGGALIKPLYDKALSLGVTILLDSRVIELTRDAITGNVSGVRATTTFGSRYTVNAKATVLATGGFDNNASLLDQYGLSNDRSLSSPGDTGEGIDLARKVGAGIYQSAALIATLEDLTTGLFDITGLIVDPMGSRIGNEAGDKFALTATLRERGYSKAWLITDSAAYRQAVRDGLDESAVVTADTIDELAQKIGATNLVFTVEQYNKSCISETDLQFGKDAKYLGQVKSDPYCAVPLTLLSYGTLGGIMTNNRCQVLDTNGNVIPGLYAAGECMNGAYFIEGLPGMGASLAQVIETGRVAAQSSLTYSVFPAEPAPEPEGGGTE